MLVHWIWYASLRGLSLQQKLKLMCRYTDPEDIYNTDFESDLSLSAEAMAALGDKDLTKSREILKRCSQLRIRIVTYRDAAYPAKLKHISDPPLVLYYKGQLPDFDMQPVIGVVGTRKASLYGKSNAYTMGSSLAACGAMVVSGGAAGIDTEALRGAMTAKLPTVAVLGTGVDVVFPASNRGLFEKIADNGCLISEYPPGTTAQKWHFPERNRIISGLSDALLVVEAPEKSGALITARLALEQGREVYAMPGGVNLAYSAGSNRLLQEGASAASTGWDILKHYESRFPEITCRETNREDMPLRVAQMPQFPANVFSDKISIDKKATSAYSDESNILSGLDELSRKVLSCLGKDPIPVDDVIARTEAPAAEVLGVLTKMSLMGLVVNHPGRMVSGK